MAKFKLLYKYILWTSFILQTICVLFFIYDYATEFKKFYTYIAFIVLAMVQLMYCIGTCIIAKLNRKPLSFFQNLYLVYVISFLLGFIAKQFNSNFSDLLIAFVLISPVVAFAVYTHLVYRITV